MCGRFSLLSPAVDLEAYFRIAELKHHIPRYNIAPTQPIQMIVADSHQGQGRRSVLVRWGLLPSWIKDTRDFPLLINARSETALTKASFRGPMRHFRTLVPASGFYEWQRLPGRRPQAFWVRPRDAGLIAFAGVMDTLLTPDGSEIDSGAILTTEANTALRHIHSRMPVVIKPEDFDAWLDCRSFEPRHVAELMQPAEDDFFEAVPVSDMVNKVANSGPELQRPVSPGDRAAAEDRVPPDTNQLSLF
ncbi:MAG: SOS response-associated peptidase [Pseudomonadota bacterium]